MTQKVQPMSAVMLISCLSEDLGVEANLVFDTIKESEDLRRVVKSYGAGDFAYLDVLDTVKDFF